MIGNNAGEARRFIKYLVIGQQTVTLSAYRDLSFIPNDWPTATHCRAPNDKPPLAVPNP